MLSASWPLLLAPRLLARLVLVDAAHVARLGHAGPLGDAVADVLDRVEARHLLLLQEEGGMALALGEDGDEHVGARHLLAAGGLHVHHGAMDDALEAGGRLRLGALLGDEGGELVVEIVGDARAQRLEVDGAGAHDRGGVAIVEKGKQQVLERRVLVAALVGELPARDAGRFQGSSRTTAQVDLLFLHGALQRMTVLA